MSDKQRPTPVRLPGSKVEKGAQTPQNTPKNPPAPTNLVPLTPKPTPPNQAPDRK
jgi:hypothetical protein